MRTLLLLGACFTAGCTLLDDEGDNGGQPNANGIPITELVPAEIGVRAVLLSTDGGPTGDGAECSSGTYAFVISDLDTNRPISGDPNNWECSTVVDSGSGVELGCYDPSANTHTLTFRYDFSSGSMVTNAPGLDGCTFTYDLAVEILEP